jgi:hypothetical protein
MPRPDHPADCPAVPITDGVPFGDYTPCACHQTPAVSPRTFRTGDRVVVVPVRQRGIVRGRKGPLVMVHFGTADNREVWAWYPAVDLVPAADYVEVDLP